MKCSFDCTIIWEHKVWQLSSNADVDNLPIEYKQRLLTEKPIYRFTNNLVEMLKASSIKLSLDNRGYNSNHRNEYFN